MAENKITELNAENFETETRASDRPVLVDFWAEWCGPCRMIAPAIAQLAEEYDGRVKFCKVNIDDQAELAIRFGVMSIPTVMIFSGGKEAEKAIGANTKEFYEQMIRRYL